MQGRQSATPRGGQGGQVCIPEGCLFRRGQWYARLGWEEPGSPRVCAAGGGSADALAAPGMGEQASGPPLCAPSLPPCLCVHEPTRHTLWGALGKGLSDTFSMGQRPLRGGPDTLPLWAHSEGPSPQAPPAPFFPGCDHWAKPVDTPHACCVHMPSTVLAGRGGKWAVLLGSGPWGGFPLSIYLLASQGGAATWRHLLLVGAEPANQA